MSLLSAPGVPAANFVPFEARGALPLESMLATADM